MNQQERNELVMRHLERAYKANQGGGSYRPPPEREVSRAILDAILVLSRQGVSTTI